MEATLKLLEKKPRRVKLDIDLIDKTKEDHDIDHEQIIKELLHSYNKLQNIFDDSFEEKNIEHMQIEEFSDIVKWKKNYTKTNIHLKVPHYYLYNREFFTTFINDMLIKYNKQLTKDKSLSKDYFNHQKLLQKYLNVYSPYRGLLLYHGLGTGKTCSSIGIAEGFKHTNKVVILTPASLQKNYIKELKMCGDPLFKFNQHWLFKSLDKYPDLLELAPYINLTEKCVKENNGIWFGDVNKPSNYDKLSSTQQKNLDHQIMTMIKSKYIFVNYNGLRLSKWEEYTKKNNNNNLFNNKVVIIDESHNFISRIANKLKTPKSLAMTMYHDLMDAENCRIILLTGTPIINYPNEIAIMFNILRGYIKSFTVNITPTKSVNLKSIIEILRSHKKTKDLFDYIEYKESNQTLLLTKNPFGFINHIYKKYKGVKQDTKQSEYKDTKYRFDNTKLFLNAVKKVLEKNKIKVNEIKPNKNYKCLPDTLEQFKNKFINNVFSINNELMLKRRILGLTSYFVSDNKKLMPTFDEDEDIVVEHIKMSKFQFNQYNIIRAEERKQEMNKKKKKSKDIYEDAVSTYRIFSRTACNYVFPDKFPRPKPNKKEELNETNIDVDLHDDTNISYNENIQKALDFLKSQPDEYLRPSPDKEESKGLNIYSPKFVSILNNINDKTNYGLHLLYSQFRTLEGIGIFKLVLEANQYEEFKLIKNSQGKWDFNITDKTKPRFVLYTGTEEPEEKELIRNIYNSRWDILPTYLIDKLKKIHENNFFGEIIKVFMITSSGAEGIDLKNTRYVHIMEPYWHQVRRSQVIGRANRLNSHIDLPEKYRTVKVFEYIMYISNDDLKLDDAIELVNHDIGKLTNISDTVTADNPESNIKRIINNKIKLYETLSSGKKKPLTSDETLYEISAIKDMINKSLLKIIKETAIDCNIHSKLDKNLICYTSLASADTSAFTGKLDIDDEETDKVAKKNIVTVEFKGIRIVLKKKPYMLKIDKTNKQFIHKDKTKTNVKKLTGDLYDIDSMQANPLLVGKLIIKDGKQQIQPV